MCEFISAVKGTGKAGNNKWYYLTHDLIHNTPTGQLLQQKYGGADLLGHSAIREYFALRDGWGENWECTDFSTPNNFPDEIVSAIKRGEFRGLGHPSALLTEPAEKLYNETIDTAWKLYEETIAPVRKLYEETLATAWKLYNETIDTAGKLYDETIDTAWKVQNETVDTAFWDFFAVADNRAKAWR